jgi:hypothetical protein
MSPVPTSAKLSALVAELHPITRRKGPLSVSEMSELRMMLDLPVYVDNPDAPKLLYSDLVEAISSALDQYDAIIAEYLFRFREPELEIGKRQAAAAKKIHRSDARQVRYPREDWVLGQLAHALYVRAMSPDRAGWQHGDGYVFTDFTIDTFPNNTLTKRTTRYSFTIRTVRNRVEFYKFGTVVKGSRKVGTPRLLSASKQQHFIASVPVDERSPSGSSWHIVRFNPKLAFGAEPTIVLEEDTELLDPTDRMREAGLTVAGLDPVSRQLNLIPTATLRVHIQRDVVPAYTRNVYGLIGDVMDRPLSSEPVERTDDTPLLFAPDLVVPERRYVLDWSAAAQ